MVDPPPHPFKVFGLQRCGTNLMQALLSCNFRVEYLEEKFTGWKHGPLRMPGGLWQGRPARFVLCVKNPYAWAVSCYRYFRKYQCVDGTMDPGFQRDPSMSFEEFLLTPSYTFETPIDRWNQMNRLWLVTLPADRTLLVRQEDQLEDQLSTLRRAEEQLRLVRLGADLKPIEQRVEVGARIQGDMERDYYLDRRYLLEYSSLLLDKANSLVDAELLSRLGYRRERWALEERQIGPIRMCVRQFTADATEARQMACDPFRLLGIKERGEIVETFVDFAAGTGATVLLAKGYWPAARIVAYESCPDKRPLLIMNLRHLPDVRVLQTAALGEDDAQSGPRELGSADPHNRGPGHSACGNCEGPEVPRASDPCHAPLTVDLRRFIDGRGELDVLKISGDRQSLDLLRHAIHGGMITRIRWICVAAEDGGAGELDCLLSPTHCTERRDTPAGSFMLARRKP
jgi:hypothetical protein